jgi:F-type H+-transporting ATPase subunit delta
VAENATVARPYAQAAFESAHGAGQLARWGEVIAALGIAISDERVAALLDNPHVRKADLVDLLAEVAGIGGDTGLRNFV